MSEESVTEPDLTRFTPYHYAALSTGSKVIYRLIHTALLNGESSLFLEGFHKDADYVKILVNVLNDFPLIFWASNYVADSRSSKGTTLWFTYNESLKDRDKLIKKISVAIDSIYNKCKSSSKADFALSVHDYLASSVVYDHDCLSDTNYKGIRFSAAHTVVGPLLNGKAVCEGFARAYNLILSSCGVKTVCVWGNIRDDDELHAWNIVRMGREWYHVDVTWDIAQNGIVSHLYFGLSDTEITGNRTYEGYVPCKGERYNFYKYRGLIFSDIRSLTSFLRRVNPQEMVSFLMEKPLDIRRAIGNKSARWIIHNGRECFLQFRG